MQLLRHFQDRLRLRKVHRHALRLLRNAGIAGGTIQLLHALAFMQLPSKSVFATTGTDNQNLHRMAYTIRNDLSLSIG